MPGHAISPSARTRSRPILLAVARVVSTVLLAAAASLSPVHAASQVLTFKTLPDSAVKAGAVCNDGSAPGYYIKHAPTVRSAVTGDSVWLVHLDGGFHCWDAQSCADRNATSPNLMSSKSWAPTRSLSGKFDSNATVNPVFADANLVDVGYCSSDSWTGNSPDDTGTPWVFRGQRIVRAVIDALIAEEGMNPAESTFVMSGCSAGGRGALYNLDFVCEDVLGGTAKTCVGFHDAAWWLDSSGWGFPAFDSNVPLLTTAATGIPLWNASVASGVCGQWPKDPAPSVAQCFLAHNAVPHVRTHLFIHGEQYDAFALPYDLGHMPPYKNKTQMDFVDKFRSEVASTMAAAVVAPNRAWSGACFKHCMTTLREYWDVKDSVNGVSMSEAFTDWLLHAKTGDLIDSCSGMGCSTGCHTHVDADVAGSRAPIAALLQLE